MIKVFNNFGDLNSHLAFEVIERLGSISGVRAEFGKSGVSESAYVNIVFDDEDRDDLKLRFAGHADRHGADHTFRTDGIADAIYVWSEAGEPIEFDDDGEPIEFEVIDRQARESEKGEGAEFSHVEIDHDSLSAIIAEATDMVLAHLIREDA